LFGLSLLAFATSPWLWLSLAALIGVGASQQVYMATNNTLIQVYVDETYRGRITSTLFLNPGMVPLGAMIAGFGTSWFGAQWAVGSMAFALVVLALCVARLAPAARDLT